MSDRPLALLTGASMGIGAAFANALAVRGYDLVLVARGRDALEIVAERARRDHGVDARIIAVDLADPNAIAHIVADIEGAGQHVDLLVNNAGFGAHGVFEAMSGKNVGQVRVNVEALVALSDAFIPGMLERERGGVINVASTAAFAPLPFMAVYGATKAFVLSFSEALAEEYRGRGVRVLALCPGATKTNFTNIAGSGAQVGRARSSEQVVATALRAYDRGASYVIDGFANRILAFMPRLIPRRVIARISGQIMR